MIKIHLSIVTPTYQNEKYISQTVKEIYRDVVARADFPTEVIIAEDGSTDKTREILFNLQKKYGFGLIADPKRKGHIQATKELYQKAKGELIFFLDSDGECPPRDFWKLYREFQKGKLDLVTGARKKRKPRYRNVISKIQDLIAQFFFGLKAKDTNCPFKIMSQKTAKLIIPRSGHLRYNFNLEQFFWAQRLNLNFAQVKIDHRKRKSVLSPPSKILGQSVMAFIEIIRFRLFSRVG